MLEPLFDRVWFFRGLSPAQCDLLRPLFVLSTVESGTIIFEQGDSAEFLYLLVEGDVLVRFKPDDGPALTVARVGPEGVVGWSTVLGNPCYTSSAVCTTACQMYRVRGVDLRALCEGSPETGQIVLERLAAVISERLRRTHTQVISLLEQGLRIGNYSPSML